MAEEGFFTKLIMYGMLRGNEGMGFLFSFYLLSVSPSYYLCTRMS